MQSNKRVTISRGNRKLGAIMNVSTMPLQCCPKGVPCADGGCYALKSLRLYRTTRKAWAKNARIAKTNPKSYFLRIANSIAGRKPRYFRWHVAGDILMSTTSAKCAESLSTIPGLNFLSSPRRSISSTTTSTGKSYRVIWWLSSRLGREWRSTILTDIA